MSLENKNKKRNSMNNLIVIVKKIKKDTKINILAFIIPAFIMLINYAIIGIFPFGEKSLLVSDLGNTYVDFMNNFRRAILGRESFIYSWNLGMGMSIIGTNTFFFNSPLNLLLALFPAKYIQEVIFMITIIKFGLAGLTSMIYLKKTFSLKTFSLLIFSTSYSLMAYTIIYTPHLMWLDSVILLPIVLMYLDFFIKENKKIGFVLFFSLAIISNIYTAYMIGIFNIIYYWYRFFISDYQIFNKKTFFKFLNFILLNIISLIISAFVIIPSYLSLVHENKVSELLNFQIIYKFGDVFSKFYIGSFDTLKPGGVPNLYCGLFNLIFVLFYFFNKNITTKKKISASIVLLIFYLSIRIRTIYMIWHGLDNPDWFEGRFSFVISFFVIYLACESYFTFNNKHKIKKRYVLNTIFILMSFSMANKYISKDNVLFINVFFLISYFIIIQKDITNKLIKILLYSFIFSELLINTLVNSFYFQQEEIYEKRNTYREYYKNLSSSINKIKNRDKSIFRIEKDFLRRENDGMSANYMGIAIFDSIYNREQHLFLRKLGLPFFDKLGRYEGTTMFTDSLFGIKYLLSYKNPNDTDYSFFDKEYEQNIFINKNALNLFTLVNKKVLDTDINKNYDNPFELQNEIINGIFNKQLNLFKKYGIKPTKIENLKIINNDERKISVNKVNNEKEGYIEYSFKLNKDKVLYAYIQDLVINSKDEEKGTDNNVNIKINNTDVSYWGGQTKKILRIQNNDILKITLSKDSAVLKNDFYVLNKSDFEMKFKKINNNVQLEKFRNTYVKFKVNKQDAQQILMTSIPYDKGWNVFINHKKGQIKKIFGSFIAIDLPKGESIIEFKYSPSGLKIGIILSLIGLLIFSVLFFRELKSKKENLIKNKTIK